jgi:glycosyltransferase involved in cell wall biosynthesis
MTQTVDKQVVVDVGAEERSVLIIAGMHRYGTSLALELLHAKDGSESRAVEDTRIRSYHDKLLERFGERFLAENRLDLAGIPTAERLEAVQLVRRLNGRKTLGFEDPNDCFFLDLWKRLVPGARFVLVYGHPLELEPQGDSLDAVGTWKSYMAAVTDFYQRHRNQAFLGHERRIASDAGTWIDAMSRKLGVSVPGDRLGKAVETQTSSNRLWSHRISSEVLKLYRELELLADLPFDEGWKRQPGRRALDRIRTAHVASLSSSVDVLEKQVREARAENAKLRERAAALEIQLQGKDEQVKAVQAHVGALEQLLIRQEAHSMRLDLKLQSIESTRAWRWALRWYSVKRFLGVLLPETAEVEEATRAPSVPNDVSPTSTTSKVLFISHDARRHGAQILLLHFLRWFKANTNIAFEIVLKGDGELRSEFEALAPVTLWNEKEALRDIVRRLKLEPYAKRAVSSLRLAPFKERLRGRSRHRAIAENGELFRERFRDAKFDLIYSNTGTNGKVLEALSGLNCPVVCHVHELDYCLNHQTERDNTEQVKKYTNHYVAVSQAVKENLVRQLHLAEDQIDVVHEFIPATSHPGPERSADIRRRLGISDDAMVVGASGTTDWRKGPDLFIQLAQSIRRRGTVAPVHFVWVGGDNEGPAFAALRHDVVHAGLELFVHFTGAVDNPLEHFALFDVFVLTSREDPFPLVNLEVASLTTPIVCFDGAGGAKEFVEDDCGFVVPYLDIEAMAESVVRLIESPALRKRLGDAAADKVRERHDVAKLAPRLLGIIERFRKNGAFTAVR